MLLRPEDLAFKGLRRTVAASNIKLTISFLPLTDET